MKYANTVLPTHFDNIVRYKKRWWKDIPLTLFAFNGQEGPFARSFDLFEDGSIQLINMSNLILLSSLCNYGKSLMRAQLKYTHVGSL